VVKVLDEGFEYDNQRYKSLSAIARKVTGSKWNGFLFFGLAGGKTTKGAATETGERRKDE